MEKRLTNYTFGLIIFGLLVLSLIYFKSLIQPFALALVVWYLIRSFRNGIGRLSIKGYTLPVKLRGALAILITFSILWLIIEIISLNVNLIINSSTKYEQNYDALLKNLTKLTGVVDIDLFLKNQLSNIDIQFYAKGLLNSISAFLGNTALVLIYVIFLLFEETFIPFKIQNMMRQKSRGQQLSEVLNRISTSINSYFTIKTIVSLLTGVLSYIVLLIFNVDFAVLWAFLIFLFNFIPYVGSLVATVLPATFAVFQFGSFLPFVWVFISVEAIQILVGNYIEPRIVGKTLNLSPLVVIIGLSFWGAIWGVVGMILSVPIISVVVIILAHFPETRGIAILFSEKGKIESTNK